ncbi:MAG TPA: phenylalanine--tRNA ligase subunit alpha [Planctomycetes bacterium]|nr:phenylalanine--tRNA ligase subunit alpha [Planctomycetota bacterium]
MNDSSPLAPNEAALLRVAPASGRFRFEDLLEAAGLKASQAQSAAESLTARGMFEREESVTRALVITDTGRAQLEGGVPELAMKAKLEAGPQPIKEVQSLPGLERSVIGSAFGGLKKSKLIAVDKGQVTLADAPGWAVHEGRRALLERLAAAGEGGIAWDALELSPEQLSDVEARLPGKRGKKGDAPFDLLEDRQRSYQLTPAGAERQGQLGEAKRQIGELTSDVLAELLKDGSWKDVEFRSFNLAEPPWTPIGRRDPYRAFLDLVKQRLIGLGFEEMQGSLVEPEFWNMDALFLPQFHPAREIHDVYFIEDAEDEARGHAFAQEIEGGALEPVALEHEGKGPSGSRGWAYDFDRERTKRLVLRSQGTVLSARWLQQARIPGKYFAMARCFRYDTVDATHAPDFFQVEGIVSSEQTSFRHLLGLLKVFASEMARSKEVMFVPAYFPFTEPSVEVHMKHPDLGWIELGGAGIFRPEVTRPHGIEAPVIAWGLGLDRMAMVALGIKDIRHLFTNNLPDGLSSLRDRVAR